MLSAEPFPVVNSGLSTHSSALFSSQAFSAPAQEVQKPIAGKNWQQRWQEGKAFRSVLWTHFLLGMAIPFLGAMGGGGGGMPSKGKVTGILQVKKALALYLSQRTKETLVDRETPWMKHSEGYRIHNVAWPMEYLPGPVTRNLKVLSSPNSTEVLGTPEASVCMAIAGLKWQEGLQKIGLLHERISARTDENWESYIDGKKEEFFEFAEQLTDDPNADYAFVVSYLDKEEHAVVDLVKQVQADSRGRSFRFLLLKRSAEADHVVTSEGVGMSSTHTDDHDLAATEGVLWADVRQRLKETSVVQGAWGEQSSDRTRILTEFYGGTAGGIVHFDGKRYALSWVSRHLWARKAVEGLIGSLGLARPSRILSIGLGAGHLEAYLRRKGWNVFGVEFVPHLLKLARKRGVSAVQGDGHALPIVSESQDMTLYSESLVHMDVPAALQEAWRVLGPGGTLLVLLDHTDAYYEAPEFGYKAVLADALIDAARSLGFEAIVQGDFSNGKKVKSGKLSYVHARKPYNRTEEILEILKLIGAYAQNDLYYYHSNSYRFTEGPKELIYLRGDGLSLDPNDSRYDSDPMAPALPDPTINLDIAFSNGQDERVGMFCTQIVWDPVSQMPIWYVSLIQRRHSYYEGLSKKERLRVDRWIQKTFMEIGRVADELGIEVVMERYHSLIEQPKILKKIERYPELLKSLAILYKRPSREWQRSDHRTFSSWPYKEHREWTGNFWSRLPRHVETNWFGDSGNGNSFKTEKPSTAGSHSQQKHFQRAA